MKSFIILLSFLSLYSISFSQRIPIIPKPNKIFKKPTKLKKGIMLGVGSSKFQRFRLPLANRFNIELNEINDYLLPALKMYIEGFLEKDFTKVWGWQANMRIQSTKIVLENMPTGEGRISSGSQTALNFSLNPAIHAAIFKNDKWKIYILGGVIINSFLKTIDTSKIIYLDNGEVITDGTFGFHFERFEHGPFAGIGLSIKRFKLELRVGQYGGLPLSKTFRDSHRYIELSAGAFLGK